MNHACVCLASDQQKRPHQVFAVGLLLGHRKKKVALGGRQDAALVAAQVLQQVPVADHLQVFCMQPHGQECTELMSELQDLLSFEGCGQHIVPQGEAVGVAG